MDEKKAILDKGQKTCQSDRATRILQIMKPEVLARLRKQSDARREELVDALMDFLYVENMKSYSVTWFETAKMKQRREEIKKIVSAFY